MFGKTSTYFFTCELGEDGFNSVKAFLDKLGCSYTTATSGKNQPYEDEPLFRFELFFDGEYQSVGLLQGLEDACGTASYQKLMQPFKDELPIPEHIQLPCCFWFTEKGLRKFAAAIDNINKYLSGKGWEVRGCFLVAHESAYLYQDELQVALGAETLDKDAFVSFTHAEDMIHLYETEYA